MCINRITQKLDEDKCQRQEKDNFLARHERFEAKGPRRVALVATIAGSPVVRDATMQGKRSESAPLRGRASQRVSLGRWELGRAGMFLREAG